MTHQTWQLIPRSGIRCGETLISFDQEREELKRLMSGSFRPPAASSYPDEDDFLTDDGSTFIRVRYQDTQVRDIEFLSGKLQYDGMNLHADTTLPEIDRQLSTRNLTLRDTQWLGDGKDCPGLAINVATHEDVGGDGDEIEWVILSSNFN